MCALFQCVGDGYLRPCDPANDLFSLAKKVRKVPRLYLSCGEQDWLYPMNAAFVAIGEAAVLLTFGTVLYFAMKKRNLDKRLFA